MVGRQMPLSTTTTNTHTPLKSKNDIKHLKKKGLPVCHTYCTHTYVLAAKNNQCTGMKNRQIMSEVTAIQTNITENAYGAIIFFVVEIYTKNTNQLTLTRPLYLNESCTDRNSNQNGHKNSKRNSSIKSAVITIAQSSRKRIYINVLLENRKL